MTCLSNIGFAAFALTGVGLVFPAVAAPLAVPASPAATLVDTVAYGCGPGWIPNRFGDCRPMYRRYGYGYGYGRPYRGDDGYGGRGHYGVRPVFHVGPFGAGISFR
ncbi:hypothetical protein [Methylobacterium sp. Leaf108]|uniref:GCG_CRPN prefix-to-repeats domain-containing protein n=1 Tax=Methylobacterium sp. Leaf108 TaxID=1736256 RepID=UPI0006F6FBC6|nr:hypothetical protein [Methylobacterium sp. Leaf108]KQP55228.1 hypothetical protein ASF39_05845 [Methylobacterium sp. Leaf108]